MKATWCVAHMWFSTASPPDSIETDLLSHDGVSWRPGEEVDLVACSRKARCALLSRIRIAEKTEMKPEMIAVAVAVRGSVCADEPGSRQRYRRVLALPTLAEVETLGPLAVLAGASMDGLLTKARVYLGIARGNSMLPKYLDVVTHDLDALLRWKTRRVAFAS